MTNGFYHCCAAESREMCIVVNAQKNYGMTHARTFDLLYSEISRYLINICKAQFIFRHAFVIQLKESLLFQTLNYLNVITALKRTFAESLKDF